VDRIELHKIAVREGGGTAEHEIGEAGAGQNSLKYTVQRPGGDQGNHFQFRI